MRTSVWSRSSARRELDIGCGTGVFALLLADRGIEVTGVDPARASIDVARAKPGGERVRWICGDATALPPLRVDLATMTAIVAPQAWRDTLRGGPRRPAARGRCVEWRDVGGALPAGPERAGESGGAGRADGVERVRRGPRLAVALDGAG